MTPQPTIAAFDLWLSERSLTLEAVVIGGAALSLLGIIDRQTRDFDILYPDIPLEVITAAREFAQHLRSQGEVLSEDWLNNGPIQVAELLPDGWRERLQPIFVGVALSLTTLGRADLLKTKLFALCDRGTDLSDCHALAPTSEELREVTPWLEERDAHPMWPEHVRNTLRDLGERLNHGL